MIEEKNILNMIEEKNKNKLNMTNKIRLSCVSKNTNCIILYNELYRFYPRFFQTKSILLLVLYFIYLSVNTK